MSTEWLALAMAAAELGGEVVRRHFRRLSPGSADEKACNDWVTAADRESEEVIRSFLARHAPGFGFMGEERGASGSQEVRWVVDPLDGTLNFVRGLPHFAVSVALVAGDTVEVGAVYDPMREELYAASRQCGATCNGRPLEVSGRAGLAGSFVTTGFPFRVRPHFEAYLAIFRDVFLASGALRRPGAAALDLVHVAAGVFDAFFEFCLAPWDIAAGALVVAEAGGVATDLDGGADFLARGNILAATPGAHRELLAIVGRHCKDADIVL